MVNVAYTGTIESTDALIMSVIITEIEDHSETADGTPGGYWPGAAIGDKIQCCLYDAGEVARCYWLKGLSGGNEEQDRANDDGIICRA